MFLQKHLSAIGLLFVSVVSGLCLNSQPIGGNPSTAQIPPTSIRTIAHPSIPAIAALANGTYQFCSQPDPGDWRTGAGVCFTFQKTGQQVEGYYGYPHSDDFICLRGTIQDNVLQGEAFALAWAGAEWKAVPQTEFHWDAEGRLTLSQFSLPAPNQTSPEPPHKLFFRYAQLNLHAFYQYRQPRMQQIASLCTWTDQ